MENDVKEDLEQARPKLELEKQKQELEKLTQEKEQEIKKKEGRKYIYIIIIIILFMLYPILSIITYNEPSQASSSHKNNPRNFARSNIRSNKK
ncbi:hypothetical protein HpBT170_02180 [Helicobacter pylori]